MSEKLEDYEDVSLYTIEAARRDSNDAIAGDNANIYRLVGVNSIDGEGVDAAHGDEFLTFEYDRGRGDLRVIARAVELLDYTLGGPDFRPDKFDPAHPQFLPNVADAIGQVAAEPAMGRAELFV